LYIARHLFPHARILSPPNNLISKPHSTNIIPGGLPAEFSVIKICLNSSVYAMDLLLTFLTYLFLDNNSTSSGENN
jgi:hypothetical protein